MTIEQDENNKLLKDCAEAAIASGLKILVRYKTTITKDGEVINLFKYPVTEFQKENDKKPGSGQYVGGTSSLDVLSKFPPDKNNYAAVMTPGIIAFDFDDHEGQGSDFDKIIQKSSGQNSDVLIPQLEGFVGKLRRKGPGKGKLAKSLTDFQAHTISANGGCHIYVRVPESIQTLLDNTPSFSYRGIEVKYARRDSTKMPGALHLPGTYNPVTKKYHSAGPLSLYSLESLEDYPELLADFKAQLEELARSRKNDSKLDSFSDSDDFRHFIPEEDSSAIVHQLQESGIVDEISDMSWMNPNLNVNDEWVGLVTGIGASLQSPDSFDEWVDLFSVGKYDNEESRANNRSLLKVGHYKEDADKKSYITKLDKIVRDEFGGTITSGPSTILVALCKSIYQKNTKAHDDEVTESLVKEIRDTILSEPIKRMSDEERDVLYSETKEFIQSFLSPERYKELVDSNNVKELLLDDLRFVLKRWYRIHIADLNLKSGVSRDMRFILDLVGVIIKEFQIRVSVKGKPIKWINQAATHLVSSVCTTGFKIEKFTNISKQLLSNLSYSGEIYRYDNEYIINNPDCMDYSSKVVERRTLSTLLNESHKNLYAHRSSDSISSFLNSSARTNADMIKVLDTYDIFDFSNYRAINEQVIYFSDCSVKVNPDGSLSDPSPYSTSNPKFSSLRCTYKEFQDLDRNTVQKTNRLFSYAQKFTKDYLFLGVLQDHRPEYRRPFTDFTNGDSDANFHRFLVGIGQLGIKGPSKRTILSLFGNTSTGKTALVSSILNNSFTCSEPTSFLSANRSIDPSRNGTSLSLAPLYAAVVVDEMSKITTEEELQDWKVIADGGRLTTKRMNKNEDPTPMITPVVTTSNTPPFDDKNTDSAMRTRIIPVEITASQSLLKMDDFGKMLEKYSKEFMLICLQFTLKNYSNLDDFRVEAMDKSRSHNIKMSSSLIKVADESDTTSQLPSEYIPGVRKTLVTSIPNHKKESVAAFCAYLSQIIHINGLADKRLAHVGSDLIRIEYIAFCGSNGLRPELHKESELAV